MLHLYIYEEKVDDPLRGRRPTRRSMTRPVGGSYTVVVKVIDILGNDTTKELKVEVK